MSWCSTRLRCCGAADTGTALAKSSSRIRRTRTKVYLLFAHEAAGTFGWENRDGDMLRQLDYLAYFDRKQSAIWWPFGPTLRSMLRDYKFFRAAAGATHSRSGVVGRGLPPAPHEDAAGDRRQVSGVFHGKVPKQRAGT